MDDKKIVTEIVDKLGYNKGAFLDNVETKIDNYIQSQSIKKCLTFVELNSDSSIYVKWEQVLSLVKLQKTQKCKRRLNNS